MKLSWILIPSRVTAENAVLCPLIVVGWTELTTPACKRTKSSGFRPIRGSSAICSEVTVEETSALVVCTWLAPPSTTTTSEIEPSSKTIGGKDASRPTSIFWCSIVTLWNP